MKQEVDQSLQVKEAASNYDAIADFFGAVPSAPALEKVAEPQPVVPTPESTEDTGTTQPGMIREKFRRAASKLAESKRQAQTDWVLALEKAANLLRAQDSRVVYRTQFEKDAVAVLGEGAAAPLKVIQRLTGASEDTPLFGGMKLAEIADCHIALLSPKTPILEAVKEAMDAADRSLEFTRGLRWIEENIPKSK
jgi:hypothetical protein